MAHRAEQTAWVRLREGVRDAYSNAALRPDKKHDFPVGRVFAESIGYPSDLLDSLPAVAIEVFAGVSNVAVFSDIPPGAHVLDLGCGAGLDALIAAQRTGDDGRVIAIDFSNSMLDRARQAVQAAGVRNLDVRLGDAEDLPVESASVDVVMVNGIFNLNPARGAIFRELARVVRAHGRVFAAELILKEPLPEEIRADASNWFA